MIDLAGLTLVTLIGLAIGSFLNVCIHRLPRRESLLWPPSRCPACLTAIAWHHNVPVVSYVVLGGRCHRCGVPIPVRYPIVEAVTGAIFVLHYLVIGPGPLLIVRLVFAAALVALFVIDLEHQILPNAITLPGMLVGFVCAWWLPPGWVSSLAGVVVGGGLLWLVAWGYFAWRGVEGLGMGDVKMLAMIGAFLGWPATVLTLLLASVCGALLGVALVAVRRGSLQLKLPFGTFLAAGAMAASLFGDPLIEWYAGFYR